MKERKQQGITNQEFEKLLGEVNIEERAKEDSCLGIYDRQPYC